MVNFILVFKGLYLEILYINYIDVLLLNIWLCLIFRELRGMILFGRGEIKMQVEGFNDNYI